MGVPGREKSDKLESDRVGREKSDKLESDRVRKVG